ncbi:MAG: YvcK family protein, partial [Chloroflexi bacterium]|nr:YvcK family protein [Chloroflexota bacterium]
MPLPRTKLWKWLRPGLHIKRWVVLLVFGILLFVIAVELILLDVLRTENIDLLSVPAWLAAAGVPRSMWALTGIVLGPVMIALSIIKLNQSLLSPFVEGKATDLLNALEVHHARKDGPKIVAIGGGTGLSTLLRGLKQHSNNITAIVTVADDGGSSGRLRQELGVLPPGDFRQCIAALAEDEALTTALFQYRFSEGGSLKGHAFGNLFIVAMAGVTGNFETALLESGKVLAIRGRIVPSTLQNVTLCAELRGEREMVQSKGESEIGHSSLPIERVYLDPENPAAYPEAVRAILDADLIVAGPGSLYTSVIPNLLVPGIAQALRHSRAPKMYVANVATQLGETVGYTLHDHMSAIERHAGKGVFTYMLVNDNLAPKMPAEYTIEILVPDGERFAHHLPAQSAERGEAAPHGTSHTEGVRDTRTAAAVAKGERTGYTLVCADVIDVNKPWRHDSRKLGRAVFNFMEARRSTRTRERHAVS